MQEMKVADTVGAAEVALARTPLIEERKYLSAGLSVNFHNRW